MKELSLVLLGLLAGALSGLIGVGGGIIIIPVLVFAFGFSQHLAQGTTLAMLVPPIGILAAYSYYKQGYVDIRIAVLIGIGFIAGAYVGARWATSLSGPTLERLFGAALFLVSIKMMVGK